MTGGSVIETNGDYDHIEIVVEDEGEQLAIKVGVSEEARSISEGDSVWWQGRKAYWSPKNRKRGYFDDVQDVELRRIGYSYKPKAKFKAASKDPLYRKFMQDPPEQKWDGNRWVSVL